MVWKKLFSFQSFQKIFLVIITFNPPRSTLIRQMGNGLIEGLCCLGSARTPRLSLYRMGETRDSPTWDGSGPRGRTKKKEDQDTCLFHELLEEQFASGRQRSSGQDEAGLCTGWPVLAWPSVLPHPEGQAFLWAVTPSPGGWRAPWLHSRTEERKLLPWPLGPSEAKSLWLLRPHHTLSPSTYCLFPPVFSPGECTLQVQLKCPLLLQPPDSHSPHSHCFWCLPSHSTGSL